MVGELIGRLMAAGVVLSTGLGVVAAAQGGRQFADAQRANQSALRQYSWQSRTELRVAGEVKQVRLEQVRFDLDGRLQKTVIGGGAAATDTARHGPPGPAGKVRERVVARKTEAFQDLLAELSALAESYAHLAPERLEAFGARAVATPGQGLETGSMRIQGTDVARSGDRMTVWIDRASSAIRRVDIATTHEGHAVTIVADYRQLDTGLVYQARSTLRYPAKDLDVAIETFDYTRSATR